ncbi:MAG: cytidylate kinase-like family protein [Eubacteriales bacterium]|nr:cytidylate kinase-like family protein [Eubacteriales bacterium]
MKKIITISREFGAAGGEIGRRVAKALDYDYFDKEIIFNAASDSNVDADSLIKWDENVPTEFGFAQSLFDFYNKPLGERLYAAQTKVIREIGEKGNCVILGRNANHILKEFDNSLHIFISADTVFRVQHIQTLLPDQSEHKIKEHIRAIDKQRKKFSMYYTGLQYGYAENYDLCLKSSSLGIDRCVDLILHVVSESSACL